MSRDLEQIKGDFIRLNDTLDKMLEEGNAYEIATAEMKNLINTAVSFNGTLNELVETHKDTVESTKSMSNDIGEKVTALSSAVLLMNDAIKGVSEEQKILIEGKAKELWQEIDDVKRGQKENGQLLTDLQETQLLLKKISFVLGGGILVSLILLILNFFV